MKNIKVVFIFLLVSTLSNAQEVFTLESKNLQGQATADEEFNGNGYPSKNRSPELHWRNAPQETKSFAITMFDPDAPTGSGWWHWVMFDIPSNVNELVADAGNVSAKLAPNEAIQSLTDFGFAGYGGPCPPDKTGIHRYVITIYALKIPKLGFSANTLPPPIGFLLYQNTIAKASLVFYDQHK